MSSVSRKCRHIFSIFYLFTACLFQYGTANQGIKNAMCDKVSVTEPYGQIISPNISLGNIMTYSNIANCAWYIKVPPGMILTLSFRLFDLEETPQQCNQKPCCGNTWLAVSNMISGHSASPTALRSNGVQENINLHYCGRNMSIPPLVYSGSVLFINYRADFHASVGRGFIIDYLIDKKVRHKCDPDRFHCTNGKCILPNWLCNGWDECGDGSDEQNCTTSIVCPNGLLPCSNSSKACYDHAKDRCNGVHDCPSGEDEQACVVSCDNRFSCRTRGGCYSSLQRCDGIRDCIDSSDEEGCDASLCGPHRDGFLCRNRRCISAFMRCDGIQDCGDYSDEETCMRMSVMTAVILGSLLCGLLLVIATGCGLRLYHLRVALEQRWSVIRQQQHQHIVSSDFDEFGRRRPVMGRLPPPTYAQAMGNDPVTSSQQVSVPVSTIPRHPSHRRHSRRSRRPAPSPPDVSTHRPTDEEGEVGSLSLENDSESPLELARPADDTGFVSRVLRRWRKHWGTDDAHPPVTNTSLAVPSATSTDIGSNNVISVQTFTDVLVMEHVPLSSEAFDTEPLIESRP